MFHCDHASKGKATLLSTLELALCPAPPWPCLPGCLKGISNSICLQFHCPSSFQPGKPAPPRLSISEIAIIIHPIVLTKKPRIRHSWQPFLTSRHQRHQIKYCSNPSTILSCHTARMEPHTISGGLCDQVPNFTSLPIISTTE